MCTACQSHSGRVENLASRADTRRRAGFVSYPPRHTLECRCRALPAAPACKNCLQDLSLPCRKTCHRSCPSTHHGPRPTARWCGSICHRTVAWSRIGRNDSDLSRGHTGDETKGTRESRTADEQVHPLLPGRPAPWFPQQPVETPELCRVVDRRIFILIRKYGPSAIASPITRHSPARGIVAPIYHAK